MVKSAGRHMKQPISRTVSATWDTSEFTNLSFIELLSAPNQKSVSGIEQDHDSAANYKSSLGNTSESGRGFKKNNASSHEIKKLIVLLIMLSMLASIGFLIVGIIFFF